MARRTLADLYGPQEPGVPRPAPPAAPATAGTPAQVGSFPPGAPPEVDALLTGVGTDRQQVRDELSGLNGPVAGAPLSPEAVAEARRRMLIAVQVCRVAAAVPNADRVPYAPGNDTPSVRRRIEQGPYLYPSQAAKDRAEAKPPAVTKAPPPPVLLTQPDMNLPGRKQPDESRPYRPGSNRPPGVST